MEADKIDIPKLKQAIRDLAVQVKEWKAEGCNRWDLTGERYRATLLCSMRAHARARLHFSSWPWKAHSYLGLPPTGEMTLELQERWIGEKWREFELQEAAEIEVVESEVSASLAAC
jgi:hypothetical protein